MLTQKNFKTSFHNKGNKESKVNVVVPYIKIITMSGLVEPHILVRGTTNCSNLNRGILTVGLILP